MPVISSVQYWKHHYHSQWDWTGTSFVHYRQLSSLPLQFLVACFSIPAQYSCAQQLQSYLGLLTVGFPYSCVFSAHQLPTIANEKLWTLPLSSSPHMQTWSSMHIELLIGLEPPIESHPPPAAGLHPLSPAWVVTIAL